MNYWLRQCDAYHTYKDDCAEVMNEISLWVNDLNQVHALLEDDVKYVNEKWMEMAKAQLKSAVALYRGLLFYDVE